MFPFGPEHYTVPRRGGVVWRDVVSTVYGEQNVTVDKFNFDSIVLDTFLVMTKPSSEVLTDLVIFICKF